MGSLFGSCDELRVQMVNVRKRRTYRELEPRYTIQPVGLETSGVMAVYTEAFVRDLGRKLATVGTSPRSAEFLTQ